MNYAILQNSIPFLKNCWKKKQAKTIFIHTITHEFQRWMTSVRLQSQKYGNIETLLYKFEDVYFESSCLCPNSLNEIVLMSWLSWISAKTLGKSHDLRGNIGSQ